MIHRVPLIRRVPFVLPFIDPLMMAIDNRLPLLKVRGRSAAPTAAAADGEFDPNDYGTLRIYIRPGTSEMYEELLGAGRSTPTTDGNPIGQIENLAVHTGNIGKP